MTHRINNYVIVLVMAGFMLAQGLYFPIINFIPAYLFVMIGCGVFVVFKGIAKRKILLRKDSITISAVLLLFSVLFSMVINSRIAFDRFFFIVVCFLFISYCYHSISTYEDVNYLLESFIIISLISAVAEIGQRFGLSFFYSLWQALHTRSMKIDDAIASSRYLGLATDSLQFGYQVSSSIVILIFWRFPRKNVLKKSLYIPILVISLLTNETRSSIIAVLFALFVFLLRSDNNRLIKKTILVVLLILIGLLSLADIGVINTFLGNTRFSNIEIGGYARIPMLLTAFNHAIHYPFGMGIYSVNPSLIIGADSITAPIVATNTAHNLFGNCVACYGFFGLACMLLFYGKLLKYYIIPAYSNKNSDVFFAVGIAIIGLIINSFFHNAYILNGDLTSVFMISILLSSTRLKHTK